ncbi:GTP binding protein [Pelomyxa schiedti]|nr:GTP binding protein [Pelomyxa schiedti]
MASSQFRVSEMTIPPALSSADKVAPTTAPPSSVVSTSITGVASSSAPTTTASSSSSSSSSTSSSSSSASIPPANPSPIITSAIAQQQPAQQQQQTPGVLSAPITAIMGGGGTATTTSMATTTMWVGVSSVPPGSNVGLPGTQSGSASVQPSGIVTPLNVGSASTGTATTNSVALEGPGFQMPALESVLCKTFDEITSQQLKPNILVVGRKGVGKTSVMNMAFGPALSTSSSSSPASVSGYETPVLVYDSKGIEMDTAEGFIRTTQQFVRNAIHVVWYVIDCTVCRLLPFEAKLCKETFAGIPIAFVLNKADLCGSPELELMKQVLENLNLDSKIIGIFITVASTACIEDIERCPKCNSDDISIWRRRKKWRCETCNFSGALHKPNSGLKELIEATKLYLPETVRESFVAAQQVSMHLKTMKSKGIILEYSEQNTEQIEVQKASLQMLSRLCKIWDLDVNKQPAPEVVVDGAELPQSQHKSFMNKLASTLKLVAGSEQTNQTAFGISWALALQRLHMLVMQRVAAEPDRPASLIVAECVDTVLADLNERALAANAKRIREGASLSTVLDDTLCPTILAACSNSTIYRCQIDPPIVDMCQFSQPFHKIPKDDVHILLIQTPIGLVVGLNRTHDRLDLLVGDSEGKLHFLPLKQPACQPRQPLSVNGGIHSIILTSNSAFSTKLADTLVLLSETGTVAVIWVALWGASSTRIFLLPTPVEIASASCVGSSLLYVSRGIAYTAPLFPGDYLLPQTEVTQIRPKILPLSALVQMYHLGENSKQLYGHAIALMRNGGVAVISLGTTCCNQEASESHRDVPLSGNIPSPSQLLLKRALTEITCSAKQHDSLQSLSNWNHSQLDVLSAAISILQGVCSKSPNSLACTVAPFLSVHPSGTKRVTTPVITIQLTNKSPFELSYGHWKCIVQINTNTSVLMTKECDIDNLIPGQAWAFEAQLEKECYVPITVEVSLKFQFQSANYHAATKTISASLGAACPPILMTNEALSSTIANQQLDLMDFFSATEPVKHSVHTPLFSIVISPSLAPWTSAQQPLSALLPHLPPQCVDATGLSASSLTQMGTLHFRLSPSSGTHQAQQPISRGVNPAQSDVCLSITGDGEVALAAVPALHGCICSRLASLATGKSWPTYYSTSTARQVETDALLTQLCTIRNDMEDITTSEANTTAHIPTSLTSLYQSLRAFTDKTLFASS